jgi:transcriptional regulator with XRE-family HTH domain
MSRSHGAHLRDAVTACNSRYATAICPDKVGKSASEVVASTRPPKGTAPVNAVEYQQVLGRRIAQERRRHGMSQPELAAIVDRPVAWVSQVERGVQPIDRLSVLKTLADALDLPLSELAVDVPADAGSAARPAADALRVVLAGAHSLCAMLGESSAPPEAELREGTEKACALARAESYGELAEVLAGLLPGLEAAARIAPPRQRPEIHELIAVSYQACAAALAKLGQPMASWIAADRAVAAAEQAGNLLLAAAGAYRLASVFVDARQYALAEESARTALMALRTLAELGDAEAVSLCGGLTLLRAVVAARTNHPSAAFGHLAAARRLAGQLGGEQANGLPEFGPQYVALYEIAVSVDLGDAGHALRVAATVDRAALPPGRHARLLIDLARAHALRRQVEEATAALLQAEALGPCRMRDLDRTRQVIRELLAMRQPAPPALDRLASRMQAQPAYQA